VEKQAGRLFRAEMQTWLSVWFDTDPPRYTVPHFLAAYRHLCPARGHRSTALECPEIYRHSPAYPEFHVPFGRYGFLWRQGVCRFCGAGGRSRVGRLVDAHTRPPLTG